MGALVGATLLMAASHLGPGWPGVKPRLMAAMGRGPYMAAYSALSLGALVFLVWAWQATDPAPSPLDLGLGWKRAAVLLMPVPLFLMLARVTTREGGIHTLVRAPGSVGVTLWALLHLFAVSDARGAVVFAGFALIGLGSLRKNLALAPPHPTRVDWRGIGLWRPAATLALWAGLLALHPLALGVAPAAYLRT
ncbi:hypothetical protein HHL28_01080 [Aerophototrophica crusticola]|uniref:NnrU domain-containing protein n=1 Tax=Aerophototrophica crusticola TaxID=1709002 RepID=A0A858R3A9_9PROT|nr:hypothetical protein HHL28_01080 [Rhodospirillaceae bacterium B3]